METSQESIVRELVHEFIILMSRSDAPTLFQKFGITNLMWDEILEIIDRYGFEISELQPPAPGQYFEEIFQMNEPHVLGVEEHLWAKGKPQEPMLHAAVDFNTHPPTFQYRGIWS